MPLDDGFIGASSIVPPSIQPYIAVSHLNPMQRDAIPHVLQGDRNLVIAAPTGSGKTLVAEVALLKECRERGRAGVYLAPMRAIAAEKDEDWRRFHKLGLRVYKTTGEDDAFDLARATEADIIIATPEKWDSISRQALSQEFVRRIGTIVMDEIHLVADGQRGAGQEAMLARLPLLFPSARLIAMSATLPNADALAGWLNAALCASAWRPIMLSKHLQPYKTKGQHEQDEEERNRLVSGIVRRTYAAGGATLVFCGSRAGVERCAFFVARTLGLATSAHSMRVSSRSLQQVLHNGVGFHHAGLERADRRAVEELFRSGGIRILVATSTVAAGVNLPARVVIVRDLVVGMSDLSASGLLQMAGRAGRPGLETEGHCYVITPTTDLERVKEMLAGNPVGSRLADDLATHINTEIALGLVRSRDGLDAWYARTLHRHVARQRVDVHGALHALIKEGFVVEQEGELRPTTLGSTTSRLMIRVPSAIALERFIVSYAGHTGNPDTLEQELLIAACGLPVELDDLSARWADPRLTHALARYCAAVQRWSQARIEYLAVAVCLLSGRSVKALGIENPAAFCTAVQQELPRYLTFLSCRANERTPGAPDIVVAAADLATALQYNLSDRGVGSWLELLKRGYPADEMRRKKVRARYIQLRDSGIRRLEDGRSDFKARASAFADARAHDTLTLDSADGHLVTTFQQTRQAVRIHTCVLAQSRMIWSGEATDLSRLALAPLSSLGAPGPQSVTAALVTVSRYNSNLWTYSTGDLTVTVPGPHIDYLAVERVLQTQVTLDSEAASRVDESSATVSPTTYRMTANEYKRLVADAPICVKQAAGLLAHGLQTDTERIDAVVGLLRRRTFDAARQSARPLLVAARDVNLGSKEAAELASALLWAMGVPARPLMARRAGLSSSVCVALQGDHWYWLPMWPDQPFEMHHQDIRMWRGKASSERERGMDAGWSVLTHYLRVRERRLPMATAIPG